MRLSEAERVELEQRRERLQLGSQGGYVMAIPKLLEAACKGSHASQGTFQESMPVTLLLRCHKELRLSITITIA